ncbi:Dihydroflavonol-4-reductase [Carex littledalei]|uniref:Dihydroflavonol-4-reductase n=1 Tax=Carex littledalei TaxID=544730 RepID=A0A833RW08_9POAL|nr:Dihydroflavonol-4-reductase [Carex littledalei]
MPPSLITALALITGTESHYMILKNIQFVHLDDLCESHIFLFENPEAKGRYICSAYDATIYDLAKILEKRYSEYNIPQKGCSLVLLLACGCCFDLRPVSLLLICGLCAFLHDLWLDAFLLMMVGCD